MRALRRAELCRVALSDVLGHADLGAVGVALSDLASATVDAGLQLARREIDAPPIGVIALGRWGGSEMSYSSDADCMFVVPDDAEGEDLARATELVRRAAALIGKPGPDPALRSLTWDQGVEMAAHHRFTDETSCIHEVAWRGAAQLNAPMTDRVLGRALSLIQQRGGNSALKRETATRRIIEVLGELAQAPGPDLVADKLRWSAAQRDHAEAADAAAGSGHGISTDVAVDLDEPWPDYGKRAG